MSAFTSAATDNLKVVAALPSVVTVGPLPMGRTWSESETPSRASTLAGFKLQAHCRPEARHRAGLVDDYFRECLRHVSRTQSGSSCDPAAPDKTRNQTDPRSTARHSPVVPQMRNANDTQRSTESQQIPCDAHRSAGRPRDISAADARAPDQMDMLFSTTSPSPRAKKKNPQKIVAGLQTLIFDEFRGILMIDTPNPLIY